MIGRILSKRPTCVGPRLFPPLTCRDAFREGHSPPADLLNGVEGQEAADEAEQGDAHRPDGGGTGPVLTPAEPLRGGELQRA